MHKQGTVFRGAMLVSGITIGGGMLALPVSTAEMGFYPSLLMYLICWAAMASTGLLFLEICLWLRNDTNIVSMSTRTLGGPGRWFAWVLYILLFYCLTLAYVVGGGDFIADLFQGSISDWTGALLFVLFFGSMLFGGAGWIGPINVVLMLGLALAYFGFVVLGFDDIKLRFLERSNWSATPKALPTLFAAFGFQGLVPTLSRYMGYHRTNTAKAILIGSFIPLLVFVIWQGLILGIVPMEGAHGLSAAKVLGFNAIRPLKHFIGNPYVYVIGQYFAFFALTTSFLGVTLGLLDFLADGLHVKKTAIGRAGLIALIFIPPLVIAYVQPSVFLEAIDLAGGIGVALLLGILPICMVWAKRYFLFIQQPPVLPGGRSVLVLLLVFILAVVVIKTEQLLSA